MRQWIARLSVSFVLFGASGASVFADQPPGPSDETAPAGDRISAPPAAQPTSICSEPSSLPFNDDEIARTFAQLEAERERLKTVSRYAGEVENMRLPTPRYSATQDEIEAVHTELSLQGIPLTEGEIRSVSRFWSKEDDLEARVEHAVQLAPILIGAGTGAVQGALLYYYNYKVHGAEFTCIGFHKAVVGGAVEGALLGAIPHRWISFPLESLLSSGEIYSMVQDVCLYGYGLNCSQGVLADTTAETFGTLQSLLTDFAWAVVIVANPQILLTCSDPPWSAFLRGDLSTVLTWIDNEFMPVFTEAMIPGFLSTSNIFEAELAARGRTKEDLLSPNGGLKLVRASTGRTEAFFTTSESMGYTLRAQVNQAGSYSFRVKLFRGATPFGNVTMRSTTVSQPGETVELTGTLSTSSIYNQGGSSPGTHTFRVEVTNESTGNVAWLSDSTGQARSWDFELRPNRKPSISIDVPLGVPFLGVVPVEVTIVDPDGTKPVSAALIVNGEVRDITPRLDEFTGSWSSGFTFNHNLGFSSAGVYTLRGRVSDAELTTFSGPTQSLRVGGIPFLSLSPGILTEVGIEAEFRTRLQDALGGVPNRPIYLRSDKAGHFTDSSGAPAPAITTDSSGWITFDYKPLETGVHTLTVYADDASPKSITHRSGTVQASCAAPEAPRLVSPADGKANIVGSTELEWYTADGAVSYEVHLGTTDPPPFHTRVNDDGSFDQSIMVSGLTPGAVYFWKVVAQAACNPSKRSESATRRFFTVGSPGTLALIRPSNGATGVPTTLALDWDNVETPGTTLYELYLGTTNPPPFSEEMNTRTVKLLDSLTKNTTYYWRVVAKSAVDPSQTSSSGVWSFRTGEGGAQTVVLTVQKDAGLRGGSFGGRNYGGQVGGPAEQRLFGLGNTDQLYLNPGSAALKGAMQFDLATVPVGSNVLNAILELATAIIFGSRTAPLALPIDPFTGSWTEGSITWNNRPGVDTNHRINEDFPLSGFNPLQLDITSLVQKWSDGSVANHGILLSIPEWESVAGKAVAFSQREDSSPPKLTVTYAGPCSAPPAPAGAAPANGASGQSSPIQLQWSASTGASAYNVYFGTSNPPALRELTAVTHLGVSGLSPNTTYFWKVEAVADCDADLLSPSPVWSFTTGSCVEPSPVALTFPADAAAGLGRQVTLSWSAGSGAEDYEVLLDTINPPTAMLGVATATALTVNGLSPATTYYWRVRARRACQGGVLSESGVSTFNTALAPAANAGSDVSIPADRPVSLGGSPSAIGGTPPYHYSWVVLTTQTGATLSDSTAANPQFLASVPGIYRCQLVIRDSLGFTSAPSEVKVEVLGPHIFSDGFESGDVSFWDNSSGL